MNIGEKRLHRIGHSQNDPLFIVERVTGPDGYRASVLGEETVWESGATAQEALGRLICTQDMNIRGSYPTPKIGDIYQHVATQAQTAVVEVGGGAIRVKDSVAFVLTSEFILGWYRIGFTSAPHQWRPR